MQIVGIDAISCYVPKLYVDIEGDWAQTRFHRMGSPSAKEFSEKVVHGIGIQKMAIADAHEDPATMAAMAARELIEKTGIDPKEVCFLAIGTETTVDQSKSMASYVIGMLENHFDRKMTHCRSPQYTFACAGAMYALESALNLFRSHENTGKYAIVIATDIARYDLYSPGENTQGAGAVALLISANPRILAMETQVLGVATRDERDFFRPNWRHTAVVDGKYSTQVYLNLMEEAFFNYTTRLLNKPENTSKPLHELLDYVVCHVPFPKMAEYMAARFLPLIHASSTDATLSLPALGMHPTEVERRDYEKNIRSNANFKKAFKQQIEPSLRYSKTVGNLYSGSLFLALVSLLKHVDTNEITGKRILLCSYGSGATSIVASGIVQKDFDKAMQPFAYDAMFATTAQGGRRVSLSVPEYEYLHNLTDVTRTDNNTVSINFPRTSVVPPANEFALTHLGTEAYNFGYRYYKSV